MNISTREKNINYPNILGFKTTDDLNPMLRSLNIPSASLGIGNTNITTNIS